jgi:hypothetical protein
LRLSVSAAGSALIFAGGADRLDTQLSIEPEQPVEVVELVLENARQILLRLLPLLNTGLVVRDDDTARTRDAAQSDGKAMHDS